MNSIRAVADFAPGSSRRRQQNHTMPDARTVFRMQIHAENGTTGKFTPSNHP